MIRNSIQHPSNPIETASGRLVPFDEWEKLNDSKELAKSVHTNSNSILCITVATEKADDCINWVGELLATMQDTFSNASYSNTVNSNVREHIAHLDTREIQEYARELCQIESNGQAWKKRQRKQSK